MTDVARILERLARDWNAPVLAKATTVEFSTRMRTSLGRCLPARGIIRLRADLQEGPPELLREVLCHEAAHVVAHDRFGPAAAPHGPEWSDLVTKAGYVPRRLYPNPKSGPVSIAKESAGAPRWFEHRCPVCQSVRYRKTAARRWHCVACREDGLEGEVEVTPLNAN